MIKDLKKEIEGLEEKNQGWAIPKEKSNYFS